MKGARAYLSPEINMGSSYSNVDADLFGASVVLYILMTGTLPFTRAIRDDSDYSLIM